MSMGFPMRVYWIPQQVGFIFPRPFKSHFGGKDSGALSGNPMDYPPYMFVSFYVGGHICGQCPMTTLGGDSPMAAPRKAVARTPKAYKAEIVPDDEVVIRRPAARTPEGREHQLIAKAYDLAERQIDDGTASSQVITHFLKLGTEREKLERAKIQKETVLLQSKIDNAASQARVEELYGRALNAMKAYAGQDPEDEDEENLF
jgi:hypothetical protein